MSITSILPIDDARPQVASDHPRRMVIKNACFDCSIGVYPEEIGIPQPVRLNLSMDTADIPPRLDDLSEVVCYDRIMSDIRARMTKGHTNLIESLLEEICAICLRHDGVLRVTAMLEKLQPIAEAESVAIEITRQKTNAG
ncbi:MAG: dihydroneopterin aldolase [SAR116 cluster bacterium]|nr:hypothetical protein [Paracoccaceae bacterium]RCL78539.1 MAG: dihydroneopterin aldolase [SAR116 cluster bacterium]RPH14586.1 MAG: dihydroneopterin aldolase [Alphaproteobacteria bacterium TMED150]HBQ23358.1 hypothetical protein [Alphaproteobacteria bacterium]|tara:strand:- start:366 stop:785 length:420 start_codon:yes stop_codon:yes gene_type:complete